MSDKYDFDSFDSAVQEYDMSAFDDASAGPGMIESAAMGAAQGGSFGFADEIVGAANAAAKGTPLENAPDFLKALLLLNPTTGASMVANRAASVAVTDDTLGQVAEDYTKARDLQRGEFAEAEAANPMSFLAGELLGGAVTPVGTVGTAGKAASSAAKIKKARDIVKAGKQTSARAGKVVQDIATMGSLGAVGGAAASVGLSEKDLSSDTAGEIASEAGDAALLGGILGAGLQTAVKGVQAGAKVVSKLPYVEDSLRVRELVKRGYQIADQEKNISKEAREKSREILDRLDQLRAFTGTIVGQSKEAADEAVGKIQIDDVVKNLRKEIDALKPIGKGEKEDVENIKEVLKDILSEQEKIYYKYIPKAKLPKVSSAEKAEQKIMKKTAESEVKDKIKLEELQTQLNEAISNGDEEGVNSILGRMAKLKPETTFPPIKVNEELTELPVIAVPRGVAKSPIAEAILPEAEDVFTPIQRVEVGSEILPGRTEVLPSEIGAFRQSIRGIEMQTPVGQRAAGIVNEGLKKAQEEAARKVGKGATAAVSDLDAANKTMGAVADVQKVFGVSQQFNKLEADQQAKVIDTLQRTILGLEDTNVPRDRFFENIENLKKQFPAVAQEIKEVANSISERYKLSNLLDAQSLEGVKRGGLALPALLGRAGQLSGTVERMAAEGARNVRQGTSKALVQSTKKIYDASPEQLQRLADVAVRRGGQAGQATAKTLQELGNAPMQKRRAVLFTLMQQPDFRELARDVFESED